VVDSIFTSGIAVEQVNLALEKLSEGESEQWVKDMRYIPSFYNQPAYINLMAQMVEQTIAAELTGEHFASQIGIVLMNHGCPHKAKGFTSGITESQALYDAVRDKLIERYPLISVGWLNHQTPLIEWTQPNATLAAENLIQLGAKAVVFMPIGFATENHETLLDVHHIIHDLEKRHSDVSYIQMPCVNEQPEFLKMVAEWANPLIEELLSDRAAVAGTPLVAAPHSHHHHHHH
jgi:ferrochelatase